MYTSHNCHVYELEAAVVLCGQIQPKITPCETKAGQRCYRETSHWRWACWLLNFLRIPDHTIFSLSHTKMTKLFPYLCEAQCVYVYLVRKATYQLIRPPLVHQNGTAHTATLTVWCDCIHIFHSASKSKLLHELTWLSVCRRVRLLSSCVKNHKFNCTICLKWIMIATDTT